MTYQQIILFCVLAPMVVYGLCRIIFATYFRMKADYLRRYFDGQLAEEESGHDRE